MRPTSRCIALALISLTVLGCPGPTSRDSSQEQASPFAGLELRAAVPQGWGISQAWEPLLEEWSAQTGARCRLSNYHYQELAPKRSVSLLELLRRDSANASLPSLMLVPVTRIAELAQAGALAPIPEDQRSAKNLDWYDLFQGLRNQVASPGGTPSVIPVASPVLVCYYRRDLLEQAGRCPPQTWSDYQELLETMPQWAPGKVAVEPWAKPFRATMFLARAVSYAKHPGHYSLFFDLATGQPLIETPGFVRALQAAQAALATMPKEVLHYTPADCRREFLSGRAALAVSYETGPTGQTVPFTPTAGAENKKDPSPNEKNAPDTGEMGSVGFVPLPGVGQVYNRSTQKWETPPDGRINRVILTAFGGLALGVSAESSPDERRAAWNLAATLARRQFETAFPGSTQTPCRKSQLTVPRRWVGEALSAREASRYVQAVARSLRHQDVVPELAVAGRARFRNALSEGLSKHLAGNGTPRASLQAVAEKWRQIIEGMGREQLLESYRHSLGLPPITRDKKDPLAEPEGRD